MNLQTIDFSDFNTEDVEQYAQKWTQYFNIIRMLKKQHI